MKVISTPNTNWNHKCTCSNCQSVLEVEAGDLDRKEEYDPREGGYTIWSVTCPVCKYQVGIGASHIPTSIQNAVKDGRVGSRRNTSSMNPPGGDFRDGPFEDFYNK